MIVDLPSTTTTEISKRLVTLRNAVGAMAMGRVLTLLVVTDEDAADRAIEVANDATRQHPARILTVVRANRRGASRLDAQIRIGGDAGASEIVILRLFGELADHGHSVVTPLLLPDSPIVAWWPGAAPADVAASPLGAMARRRITDAAAADRPTTQLRRRAKHYQPGDTDLAWTRITRWRGLLAAALDEAPFEPVTAATVTAAAEHPEADLLAAWLAAALDVPVRRVPGEGSGLRGVRLERESGPIDLVRSPESVSTLSRPGSPVREVTITRPEDPASLAAELRRLDADEIYAAALTEGLSRVSRRSTAPARGAAPAAASPPPTPSGKGRAAGPSMSSRALANRSPKNRAPSDSSLADRIGQALAEVDAGTRREFPDPDTLAAAVAREAAEVIDRAVAARGVAHLVLTGGSMGARTVTALAALDLPEETWAKVHLWWGDERFVPAGHEDRNDQQADDAGLGSLPVPADQVHRCPAGEDASALPGAAADWATELAAHAPQGGLVPAFDVVLLGLGPDAHVASLFPDRAELAVTDRSTVPVTASPKPPPLRVSLTVPAIRAAERVWFVVAGADKADAVRAVREARDDPHLPGSWVRGRSETVWWLDEAAAR